MVYERQPKERILEVRHMDPDQIERAAALENYLTAVRLVKHYKEKLRIALDEAALYHVRLTALAPEMTVRHPNNDP